MLTVRAVKKVEEQGYIPQMPEFFFKGPDPKNQLQSIKAVEFLIGENILVATCNAIQISIPYPIEKRHNL